VVEAAGAASKAGVGAGAGVGMEAGGARAVGAADSTVAPALAPAQAPATAHHKVAMKWFHEYHSKNYMLRDKTGKLVAATMYYDPVLDYNHALDAKMGLGVAWYTLPQSPELARAMYDAAVDSFGWRDVSKPIATIEPASVRWAVLGMLCARELGDNLIAQRLEEAMQDVLEPRFFGGKDSVSEDGEDDASEFGYFFHLGEEWPRGQLNSLMMCNDLLTAPGDWLRVFQNGNAEGAENSQDARFSQPTVEGIAFPAFGVCQARNDGDVLTVETYVGTAAAANRVTEFRVTNIAAGHTPTVVCDGVVHTDWTVVTAMQSGDGGGDGGGGGGGGSTLCIKTTIAPHLFTIQTGTATTATKL